MSTSQTYDNDCNLIKEIEDINEIKELVSKYKKEGDYNNMILYLELAIKKNDVESMISLAKHFEKTEPKKYESNMLMAIEKDNIDAMNNLAYFYQKNGNMEEGKKYFLMAIEKGHTTSMWMLANLFKKEGDIESMKKYNLMAIDKGDEISMYNLAIYYQHNNDLPNAKKYFSMASAKGNKLATGFLTKIEEYEKSKYFSSKFNTEVLENYLITSWIHIANVSIQMPINLKNQIKTKQDLETIINDINNEIGNFNQYRNNLGNVQRLLVHLNSLTNKLGLNVMNHNFGKYGV